MKFEALLSIKSFDVRGRFRQYVIWSSRPFSAFWHLKFEADLCIITFEVRGPIEHNYIWSSRILWVSGYLKFEFLFVLDLKKSFEVRCIFKIWSQNEVEIEFWILRKFPMPQNSNTVGLKRPTTSHSFGLKKASNF